MKRILKALSAFALSLVITLTLAAVPVSAAENVSEASFDVESAGYLIVLDQARPLPFSADPLAAATLLAAADEREELLPLSEDWNIYKAASLDEIQSLVYAGQVTVAEPDYKAELFDVVPVDPNDPKLGQQQNLTGVYGINVRSAWESGLTGRGVTVAVIDSGLNDYHIDAPTKIGRGRYFFYREEEDGRYDLDGKHYGYYSSGNWADDVGHGSMVCGVIAANTNNGEGIASIAPDVTILPIRCFTNTPGHLGGYTSNLISGLNYAVENGADIINMSWGVKKKSSSLQTAVNAAYQAGCILVAAAGNDGTVLEQYPAAWAHVISVGATDKEGRLTYYSQRVTSVDICAPGGVSRSPIVSLDYKTNTGYQAKIGTSFSTPQVAAAAALLLEADPTMTQGDFLTLLKNNTPDKVTVDDKGNTSASNYSGAGRLNIQALLDGVGYLGCSAWPTEDGFSVYAGFHPAKDDPRDELIAMVGGYNEKGHLVESHSRQFTLTQSQYNNCAGRFDFQDPTIVEFRTFYLDSDTLVSFHGPISPVIGR